MTADNGDLFDAVIAHVRTAQAARLWRYFEPAHKSISMIFRALTSAPDPATPEEEASYQALWRAAEILLPVTRSIASDELYAALGTILNNMDLRHRRPMAPLVADLEGIGAPDRHVLSIRVEGDDETAVIARLSDILFNLEERGLGTSVSGGTNTSAIVSYLPPDPDRSGSAGS